MLNDPGRSERKKRIHPPVSSAKGGLMPGIDLNDTAAFQESDDLETVARLR